VIGGAINRDVHWRGGSVTNFNVVLDTVDGQLESLCHLQTLDGRFIDRLRPPESQLDVGAFALATCGSDAVDRPRESAIPRAITATCLPVRPAFVLASMVDGAPTAGALLLVLAVSSASMADGASMANGDIVLLPVMRSRRRLTVSELSAPPINRATIINAASTTKTTPIPTPVTIRASMKVSESDVVMSPCERGGASPTATGRVEVPRVGAFLA
jgi:hypothetical protein